MANINELNSAASIFAKSAAANQTADEDNVMANPNEFDVPQTKPEQGFGMVEDDDDIIATPVTEETTPIVNTAKPAVTEITMADVRATMPNLDETEMAKKAPALMSHINAYRKRMIIEEGMTPEEADAAARKRLKKQGEKINNEYIDSHPHTGVITINKADVNKVELTPEEHEKLVTTKAIKLVMVESQELETLKIASTPANMDKLLYIQNLNSTVAHYEMPLPCMGDYMSFRGATTVQLTREALDQNENETVLEALERKANFIYDRMLNSASMKKYDEEGHIIMNFDEFCQKFPYFDVDMALYGIYVASSPESYTGTLVCPHCKKDFDYTFVAKDMLIRSELSEPVRESITNVMAHFKDNEYLIQYNAERTKSFRMRSPKTKNIYTLQVPSISRAQAVFKARTPKTSTDNFSIMAALMLREMFIYSERDDAYIHVDSTEVSTIIKLLDDLNEYDTNLILKLASDYICVPSFGAKHNCPNCGKETDINVSLEDLVFLRAQDILAEIQ